MTLPYTPTANAVIKRASRLASEFSHREVTTGHLLTSMAGRSSARTCLDRRSSSRARSGVAPVFGAALGRGYASAL